MVLDNIVISCSHSHDMMSDGFNFQLKHGVGHGFRSRTLMAVLEGKIPEAKMSGLLDKCTSDLLVHLS